MVFFSGPSNDRTCYRGMQVHYPDISPYLHCIKKGKKLQLRRSCNLKSVPDDYVMKLGKIMPIVCKAMIKVNTSYIEEYRKFNHFIRDALYDKLHPDPDNR